MTHHSSAVEVRRSRGVLVVNGLGKTPRGQRFIAKQVKLKATDMGSKEFKSELAAAVAEIIGSEAPTP